MGREKIVDVRHTFKRPVSRFHAQVPTLYDIPAFNASSMLSYHSKP
jgi:hypothetical protein